MVPDLKPQGYFSYIQIIWGVYWKSYIIKFLTGLQDWIVQIFQYCYSFNFFVQVSLFIYYTPLDNV